MKLIDTYVPKDVDFHTYNSMKEDLFKLERQFPNYVTCFEAGETTQKRIIYGLEIYDHEYTPDKAIVIVAGHHGIEPAGPEAAYYFGKKYLESESLLADTLKKEVKLIIVPMINSDSYALLPKNRTYSSLTGEEMNSYKIPSLSKRYKQNEPKEVRTIKRTLIDKTKDLEIILSFDLHETKDFTGFALFESYTGNKNISYEILKAVSSYYPLEHKLGFNGLKTLTQGTTFSEWMEYLGAHKSFTFETPRDAIMSWQGIKKITLAERIEMDLIGIDAGIHSYFEIQHD